jgi:hypothetical protein
MIKEASQTDKSRNEAGVKDHGWSPHDMWEFGLSPIEIKNGKRRAIKQAKATIKATVIRGTHLIGHPSIAQREFCDIGIAV